MRAARKLDSLRRLAASPIGVSSGMGRGLAPGFFRRAVKRTTLDALAREAAEKKS
ncbi:MAG: hypothetical protein JRE70_09780 [Deltaproteobacteria bacterium]|nr:hypothetical protein [Deltaproteobacteria bacterium]